MSIITEYNVIDFWHILNLSFTNKNKAAVIESFLCQLFANSGLELTGFGSPAYRALKHKCVRIVDKTKANKRNKQSKYYGFSDPEKIFFCESEFPELFKKDVPKR